MVQVNREQKKTLRKFLDIAYRRGYISDEDLWGLQVDFAPTEGYWGTSLGNFRDNFWEFMEGYMLFFTGKLAIPGMAGAQKWCRSFCNR